MATIRKIAIKCDSCENEALAVNKEDGVKGARLAAKQSGFIRKNKKDVCGFCNWTKERK